MMVTSKDEPECPRCARTFHRNRAGVGFYEKCRACHTQDLIAEAARIAAERARTAERHWHDVRLSERGSELADDLGDRPPFPNPPRRRNSDESLRELRRQVAAGDDAAVLRLVNALLRAGQIEPAQVQLLLSQDAGRREGRAAHNGYRNYETFTIAHTLDNREVFSDWARRLARILWDRASEADRADTTATGAHFGYAMVTLRLSDYIQSVVRGWAPEKVSLARTMTPRSNLDPDLLRTAPRDASLLSGIFSTLLSAAFEHVDWREIAVEYLHRAVPESNGYQERSS